MSWEPQQDIDRKRDRVRGALRSRALQIGAAGLLAFGVGAAMDAPETPQVTSGPVPAATVTETVTAAPTPTPSQVRVARVVDGDTLETAGGDRVRLAGIDTPERGQCGYVEATRRLEAITKGRPVTLTAGSRDDRDRYGRLIRYVDVDGGDAGLELIEDGLAHARYDSRDGYGPHEREAEYVAADAASEHMCEGEGSAPLSSGSVAAPTPTSVAPTPKAAPKHAPKGDAVPRQTSKAAPRRTPAPKATPKSKQVPAPKAKPAPKPAPTLTRPPQPVPPQPTLPQPTRTKPKPKPKPAPAKPATSSPPATTTTTEPAAPPVLYANCDEVRAAGAAPIRRGQPGYSPSLDRDGDGVACE